MATTQVMISPEALKASQHSQRSPDPCIVVIFGASGDLTKRKLLPALYHLEQAGNLPDNFAVVGVARRPLGDSFAADMKEGIEAGGGVDATEDKLDESVDAVSSRLTSLEAQLRDTGERLLANAKELSETAGKQMRTHPLAAFGVAFVAGIAVARLLRR